jgi:hypothetical protein
MVLEQALRELDAPSAKLDIEESLADFKQKLGAGLNKDRFNGFKV